MRVLIYVIYMYIAAHQLKKAAYARFAGRVLFNARPVLEIFRRRK